MATKSDIELFEYLTKAESNYIEKWKGKKWYSMCKSILRPAYYQNIDSVDGGYVRPTIFLPDSTKAAFMACDVFVPSVQTSSNRSLSDCWVLRNLSHNEVRSVREKLLNLVDEAERSGYSVFNMLLNILNSNELERTDAGDVNQATIARRVIADLINSGDAIGRSYLVRHLASDNILPTSGDLKGSGYPSAHAILFPQSDLAKYSRGVRKSKDKSIGRQTSIDNIELKKFTYLQYLESLRIVFTPNDDDRRMFSGEDRSFIARDTSLTNFIRKSNYDASYYY